MLFKKEAYKNQNLFPYYSHGEWFRTINGMRFVSSVPGPVAEIIQTGQEHSRYFSLYNESCGNLCMWSPYNFLGNFVLALYRESFLHLYAKNGIADVPEYITRPFVIYKDLPLCVRVGEYYTSGCYEMVPYSAETVAVKYACGKVAGIILEGPLAGLIVEEPFGNPDPAIVPPHALSINRLWNDELLGRNKNPDEPDWTDDLNETPFSTQCTSLYLHLYHQLTKKHTWSTEALFDMIERLNQMGTYDEIAPDTDNFLYTRNLSDTEWYFQRLAKKGKK